MMNMVDTASRAIEVALLDRPLDELLRHAAAQAAVDEEELLAVESRRPTEIVFQGEPWR